MVYLQSFRLSAVLLFTALMKCGAHDYFNGYNHLTPKPRLAPIFTQQSYNQRNGFEVKLSLPMANYFNPNVLESIVNIRSEYKPVPITLNNGYHIERQNQLHQQNKDKNTISTELYKENIKPTENELNKGNDNQYDNYEDEYIKMTAEYTETTTEYDYLSTTEDYDEAIANRVAPEVVASLLG